MTGEAIQAAEAFALPGPIAAIAPHPGGHINASYLVTCGAGGGESKEHLATERFLLQRINCQVFRDPIAVMKNIARVLAHLEGAGPADDRRAVASGERGADNVGAEKGDGPSLIVPRLVRTPDGASYFRDGNGALWRMFRFIDAVVHESVTTPELAFEAGRAFGAFQRRLCGLSPRELAITLPGFHDTPERLAAFERAVARDAVGRARGTADEIERVRDHAARADALHRPSVDGRLPTRIAHNDAKITNVLFHPKRDAAIGVVDLDTVLPGLALHDFGDMMRSMLCLCREDEVDLSGVEVRPMLFEGLASGYLSEADAFITALERELLATSGSVITLEQAARFLSDYLCGDVYYSVAHASHNLDRARVQLRLLESMVRQEADLRDIVARA